MKKRVKVKFPKQLPKAVEGMNVTGKINNMDGSQNSRGSLLYQDNNAPTTSVNRTLKPTERENATLEAEKGETVVTNLAQTGIPEFYTIGGKRHHAGGTPLSLPPDSFIFSRDRKLMVKDKDILEQFGKSVGKKGKKKFTFADLSKKFDNGMYRQILADPSSDKFQIDTAQMMIKNYNLKLGALALVQESKKGFPDGIPGISMPYLEHTGMDPSKFELPQMRMGGQAPMPQMNMGMMPMGRYGMNLRDYYLPMAQNGTANTGDVPYADSNYPWIGDPIGASMGNYDQQGQQEQQNQILEVDKLKMTDTAKGNGFMDAMGTYGNLIDPGFNLIASKFEEAKAPSTFGVTSTSGTYNALTDKKQGILDINTGANMGNKTPVAFGSNRARYGGVPAYNYGGIPMYEPGGPNIEDQLAAAIDPTLLATASPASTGSYQGPIPSFNDANLYMDFNEGRIDAQGNVIASDLQNEARATREGFGSTQAYFDAVEKQQGFDFDYRQRDYIDETGQPSTEKLWSIPTERTAAWLAQQNAQKQVADEAKGFKPAMRFEAPSKGFSKGRMQRFIPGTDPETGEFGKWAYSTAIEAKNYAKKYGTGDMTGRELQAAINDNPEAFVNSFGQPAQDAALANLTLQDDGSRVLKKFGGESDMPMFAPGGAFVKPNSYNDYKPKYGWERSSMSDEERAYEKEWGVWKQNQPVNEDDYTTALDAGLANDNNTYANAPGTRRVRVSYGSEPQVSSRATSYQDIPKGKRKWDMNTEGYDEASVQPGDYVKKTDGKWYKTETVTRKTTPYEGQLDERLGDLGEAYGRLENRLLNNEKLQDALYKKYKTNMAKAKPRNNLSEADLEAARKLTKAEVVDNFLRAQKQIMAVQAKGPLENADAWDKDLGYYNKAMTDMKFTPMNAAETAAFQGAYISMQNLADADPKFRKELNDFVISSKTRKGKADEPGGGTGKATISDIDGWFGNTTIGESMLYAPKDTELEMKEVEWKKIKNKPEVKRLRNQYGAQKTPFWTEDLVNFGFAAKNLFGIRKERPWMAKALTKLPRPTFLTPDQQIQGILGAQAKGIRGASNIGSPQAYAATIASIQANAMQNVANAIGNVHDKNVQIANMFENKRSQIINNANIRDAQLATSMHDKNAILNQQFRNSKNKAWDVVRRMGNKAWTNRGMTQNLNTFNDQYFVDPRTGYKHFYNPRELRPTDSQRPELSARINQLVRDVPGLSPNEAGRLINKEEGFQAQSPTGQMGMDPQQMGYGYPGGAPEGYYPQG